MSMIEVDGLVKWHGSIEVLKGVNLSVRRGEVAAIIGAIGQRQEHVPALPQRAGDIPGWIRHGRRPAVWRPRWSR